MSRGSGLAKGESPVIQTGSGAYRVMVWLAVATGILVVGSVLHEYVFTNYDQGELHYRRGNLRLEDGRYQEALAEFEDQLRLDSQYPPGHLGKGLALMGLHRNSEAVAAIDRAIALQPDFAAAFANRGILHDRMGRNEKALDDYRKALQLDATLADGPGWITRFFRKQPKAPPTIRDRAVYLEQQLKKPAAERLLRVPELDSAQRSYKVERNP